MQKITPFLWFNNNAEEAANFYVSIFKKSHIKNISRNGGTIITPRRPIPNGSYARIADSEGNIIGIVDNKPLPMHE
jgi:predicted enzyme related to lactoylglutathione lyase